MVMNLEGMLGREETYVVADQMMMNGDDDDDDGDVGAIECRRLIEYDC